MTHWRCILGHKWAGCIVFHGSKTWSAITHYNSLKGRGCERCNKIQVQHKFYTQSWVSVDKAREMGWFKRNAHEYPEWDIREEDFLVDSIDNYMRDPHLLVVLTEASRLIHPEWRDQVFIGGGFAAQMAGITREHHDCDIFCMTEEAFAALTPLIQDNKEVTDRGDERKFLDVNTAAYGRVVKFKFRGLKFDLVDLSERTQDRTIIGMLKEFDINWSMVGISLQDKAVVLHKEALSVKPRINPSRADIFLEGTRDRIKKYRDRLFRDPDTEVCDELIKITNARIDKQHKEKTKSSSWY